MKMSNAEIQEAIDELEQSRGWKLIINNLVSYFKSVRDELETASDNRDLDMRRKGELKAIRFAMNLPEQIKENYPLTKKEV